MSKSPEVERLENAISTLNWIENISDHELNIMVESLEHKRDSIDIVPEDMLEFLRMFQLEQKYRIDNRPHYHRPAIDEPYIGPVE